jgi:hypothetical protein
MPRRREWIPPEPLAQERPAFHRPITEFTPRLILFPSLLLPKALTREGLLGATSFSGLHEIAVLLDFFNDVFRLHFSLEAPEGVFQRLALLNYNFSHAYSPPFAPCRKLFGLSCYYTCFPLNRQFV